MNVSISPNVLSNQLWFNYFCYLQQVFETFSLGFHGDNTRPRACQPLRQGPIVTIDFIKEMQYRFQKLLFDKITEEKISPQNLLNLECVEITHIEKITDFDGGYSIQISFYANQVYHLRFYFDSKYEPIGFMDEDEDIEPSRGVKNMAAPPTLKPIHPRGQDLKYPYSALKSKNPSSNAQGFKYIIPRGIVDPRNHNQRLFSSPQMHEQ